MAKDTGITDTAGKAVSKLAGPARSSDGVPGPSPNPATNLIIHDLALRSVGRLARLSLEKGLLGRRYGHDFAKKAIGNRSLLHTATAYAVTKVATRSLPGAAVVWGGLLAKTLFDRRQGKRAAKRAGEKQLREQAKPGTLL